MRYTLDKKFNIKNAFVHYEKKKKKKHIFFWLISLNISFAAAKIKMAELRHSGRTILNPICHQCK